MADVTGGAQQITGDIAHDAADSGNPLKVGSVAIAHGTNPTAVAAADRTDLYANRHGIPWVIGGHPNVITNEGTQTDAAGAQTDRNLAGTVAPGTKVVVTRISVMCSNANSVDMDVRVGFAATSLPAEAVGGVNGILLAHPGIPPGSGVIEGNGAGILGIGGDGEELRYTTTDATGGEFKIVVSYYTIES